MPITAAPNDRRCGARGFTLIEMLVVLTIIALLAAVAVPALNRQPGQFKRERSAAAITSLIADARRAAQQTGNPVAVDLNALEAGSVTVLPAVGTATDQLIVFPDNSSTGGLIKRAGKPLLQVDWLTSQVRLAR